MADTRLGRLCQIDGWLTDSRWYSSIEGPYTALAKFSIANAMTSRDLCRALGVSLRAIDAFPVHGLTLLDMRWAGKKSGAAIAAHFQDRCLASASDRWWRGLASDRRLRFCPSCISSAFQSVLCQIDALIFCPVHGDTIVDTCPACRKPTPRYALTQAGFDEPMTCPHCGKPYAACWAHSNPIGSWAAPDGLQAYSQFESWLQLVDEKSFIWPDEGSWYFDPIDTEFSQNRRVLLFELLTKLCKDAPIIPTKLLDIHSFELSEKNSHGLFEAEIAESRTSRKLIYKSIRRHYRAALKTSRLHVWQVSDDLVWDSTHQTAMPTSRRVTPELHAFLSWRARFELALLHGEVTTRRDGLLEMRLEVVDWPMNWRSSDRAWGHFAHACLLQELIAAREFNDKLGDLDGYRDDYRSAWTSLVARVFHRFGPAYQMWPATVGCLLMESDIGGIPPLLVLFSVLSTCRWGARSGGASNDTE